MLHDVRVSTSAPLTVTLTYVAEATARGSDIIVDERKDVGFDVPNTTSGSQELTVGGVVINLYSIDSATTKRSVAVWRDAITAFRVMLEVPARGDDTSLVDIVKSLAN